MTTQHDGFPLRRAAATLAGKAALQISRRLGVGGGTQLPGVVARRVAPHVLRDITTTLAQGTVLVTGTNGKTTTARMLASILHAHGWRTLHNRAGANLITGLTATAIAGADLLGRTKADAGIFETDEAHVPAAIAETKPRVVLMHNLFRDQLDRYGEVDTIAKKWKSALQTLPPTSTVVLNADDPAVADLGEGLPCQVMYYGLQDTRHGGTEVQHMADSQFCRRCGAPYIYEPAFYGHIGHYRCPRCGHHRPTPDVRGERLALHAISGSTLVIQNESTTFDVQLPIPGLYNGLNALAAASAALALGIPPATIKRSLETFSAAFGRIERIQANGRDVLMALIKNPVGASETVRMIVGDGDQGDKERGKQGEGEIRGHGDTETKDLHVTGGTRAPRDVANDASQPPTPTPQPLHLMVVINDKIADGTDVSWLWDANFEQLEGRVERVVVSGTRAADMAVRLKYAGVPADHIVEEPELDRAFDRALNLGSSTDPLYLLPTYTAMLELRAELARRGFVRPFWED
jgi:UDP-N-acetylmuramyl tripeptide synthase